MQAVLAQLFTTIDSVAAYDSINAKFSSSKSIHQQFTKQMSVRCGDIKSYIQNVQRRAVRAEQKLVPQARAECATRATGAAEEAAEKARKRLAEEAPSEEAVGIYVFVRE